MSTEIDQLDDGTQIVEQHDSKSSAPSASQADKIVTSLEVLITMQEQRSVELRSSFQSLEERLNEIEQAIKSSPGPDSSFPSDDESDIEDQEWNHRKQSILAGYGLTDKEGDEDGDKLEDKNEATTGLEAEDATLEKSADKDVDQKQETEYEIPAIDAAEIDALKEELRQKIRESEVKLSIKRTKLEQREARIEEKLAQLERRREYRDSVDENSADDSSGMLGRLKKHLQVFSKAKAEDTDLEEAQISELAEELVDELANELEHSDDSDEKPAALLKDDSDHE